MKLNNLLKAITLALIVNGSWANQREDIQMQLQTKLQSLATETDETKQRQLKLSITMLRNQLNRESMMTDVDNQRISPDSPIGSINPELRRDTYFYRGPIQNQSSRNPNLSTSWDARGYGGNSQFTEGAPVQALNAINAHTNEIPGQRTSIHRNPFTNPDYEPGHQFYQNNRPGVNYRPNHWGNGFNPNFGNGFNNQWGNQNNQSQYQNSWNGYGNNQNFGPYQGNSIVQQQRSREMATFDAKTRLEQELKADPRFVSNQRLNIVIDSVSEIDGGQLQVVARIAGGITGQNRNEQRVFIYTQQGSFVKQVQNVQGPINTGNQTIRVQNYDLSNNQKFSIDRFLAERGLNQYGDPRGTMYAGGNPLGLVNDGGGQSREGLRFNYILNNHKQLLDLFQISK